MATSQEKSRNFKEALRGKGNQIFLAVMALLVAGRIYLFMQESGFQNTELAKPKIMSSIPSAIKQDTEEKVNKMIDPLPEFSAQPYYTVTQVNMFDPRTVQNADTQIARGAQFFAQAQGAFDRKSWAEADMLVKEALKTNPNLAAAQALREKLKTAMTSSTVAASKPTPAPSATPAPAH